jgi:hypothetical protein
MFGDEFGLYPRSSVLELWLLLMIECRVGRHGCAPLLGLRNEIVVGTVTSVVTVRMKKGKNCPCNRLAARRCCGRVAAHLFVVVVVGPGHAGQVSSGCGLEMCLRSDERKYYFSRAKGACTVGQEGSLRPVACLSRCGESQRKSWSNESGFRPLCSFLGYGHSKIGSHTCG